MNPYLSNSSIGIAEISNDAQGRHYKVTGNETTEGKVPVGKIARFTLIPPVGLTFESIAWAGGTQDKTYDNGPAIGSAPGNMALNIGGVTVATDEQTYAFIVDPDPRTYDITASVTYVGGGGGAVDLSFESIRPDVSLSATQQSAKLLTYPTDPMNPDNGGFVAIRLDDYAVQDPEPPVDKDRAGMHIWAQTTTYQFDGQFMFLQIASPVRITLDVQDQRYRQIAPGGGWSIDNSFNEFSGANPEGAIGYPITDKDPPQGNWYMWWLDGGQTETHHMGDSPRTPNVPMSFKNLQVGDLGASRPEKFITYVMYKPTFDDTAVWVALAKVEWEWGALASNNNGAGGLPADWQLQTFPGLNPYAIQNEIGPGDRTHWYPSWNSRTTEILDQGWQEVP